MNYEQYTLVQLKDLLKSTGQTYSYNKKEVIRRLLQSKGGYNQKVIAKMIKRKGY